MIQFHYVTSEEFHKAMDKIKSNEEENKINPDKNNTNHQDKGEGFSQT